MHEEKHMTTIRNAFLTAAAVSVLLAAVPGCENKEGPAERAGKEIDKSVENAGKQIEKVGDKIQDAAKDAKK